MSKRIGVVLSGCGVYDGAEIHEAVITLLALDRLGAEVVACAPDRPQMHVIDHVKGEPVEGETRNVLVEASRIVRGEITDVAKVDADSLDAVILPGGFGAAKNLCDFAVKGPDCDVDAGVAKLIGAIHAAGKPIGAICIAPAVIAKVLGDKAPTLTIGDDADTAAGLEKLGARHQEQKVDEICFDETNKIVSTPAYMCAKSISEAASGIEKLVFAVYEMA